MRLMESVMFEIFAGHSYALNGAVAERLAAGVETAGATPLAERIRHGLSNDRLVKLTPFECETIAAQLERMIAEGKSDESALYLEKNLRRRIESDVDVVLSS